MDNTEYGVITEQGDLGLGFDPLNDKDQKVYSEAVSKSDDVVIGGEVIQETK